jgi:hypothetical protein
MLSIMVSVIMFGEEHHIFSSENSGCGLQAFVTPEAVQVNTVFVVTLYVPPGVTLKSSSSAHTLLVFLVFL